jgi:hypothetical protein
VLLLVDVDVDVSGFLLIGLAASFFSANAANRSRASTGQKQNPFCALYNTLRTFNIIAHIIIIMLHSNYRWFFFSFLVAIAFNFAIIIKKARKSTK